MAARMPSGEAFIYASPERGAAGDRGAAPTGVGGACTARAWSTRLRRLRRQLRLRRRVVVSDLGLVLVAGVGIGLLFALLLAVAIAWIATPAGVQPPPALGGLRGWVSDAPILCVESKIANGGRAAHACG